MNAHEIHAHTIALLTAAVRGDEQGLALLTEDLELSDARDVAEYAGRMYAVMMRAVLDRYGAPMEAAAAVLEQHLITFVATDGEQM